MKIVGGLMPERLLWSQPFRIFALVAGINSLVFLGLTFSKFIPWPRQIPPQRIR